MAARIKLIRVGLGAEDTFVLQLPDRPSDIFARICGEYPLDFRSRKADAQQIANHADSFRIVIEPALVAENRRIIVPQESDHALGAARNLLESAVKGMAEALHHGGNGIAWIAHREQHVAGCEGRETLQGSRWDMRFHNDIGRAFGLFGKSIDAVGIELQDPRGSPTRRRPPPPQDFSDDIVKPRGTAALQARTNDKPSRKAGDLRRP